MIFSLCVHACVRMQITGQEEAIYQATVTVASKGRKDDLAVKNRDIVSIIRTTNCPKGKWLARDSTNTCKLHTYLTPDLYTDTDGHKMSQIVQHLQ